VSRLLAFLESAKAGLGEIYVRVRSSKILMDPVRDLEVNE